MKKGYNGYLINSASRSYILQHFPAKYKKIIAHHITHAFGVYEEIAPQIEMARVIGYADTGDGLEAFVVELDGKIKRPDGKIYHITYSLDSEKYKPKDSNSVIEKIGYKPIKPFLITIEPKFFPMN